MDRQSIYQQVLAEVARKHGLSVADLISRLETEAALSGPGGRDVCQDAVWDWVGRSNPWMQTGEAGKAGPTWDGQRGTGWVNSTPLEDWRRR
jgi:hypothetical protein